METTAENFYLQQKTTNGVPSTTGLQHLDGIHHRDTPPAGSVPYSKPGPMEPKLSTMAEGNEEGDYQEGSFNNEMSAEAQAHNISMFLSSSNSDSGELMSEGDADLARTGCLPSCQLQ